MITGYNDVFMVFATVLKFQISICLTQLCHVYHNPVFSISAGRSSGYHKGCQLIAVYVCQIGCRNGNTESQGLYPLPDLSR